MNVCHLCQGKVFFGLGMNAVQVPLDREPASDGEYTFSNGRAVPHDPQSKDQSAKRYRKHKCKGGTSL